METKNLERGGIFYTVEELTLRPVRIKKMAFGYMRSKTISVSYPVMKGEIRHNLNTDIKLKDILTLQEAKDKYLIIRTKQIDKMKKDMVNYVSRSDY